MATSAADTHEGYSPERFAALAEVEPQSFWFRARNELLVWALQRYFPAAGSLLEVGCGNGYVLAALGAARPGLRLAGADLHPEALRLAGERAPTAELVQADVRRLPYEGEFDVVGAFDVIEHTTDDEAALRGLARAVKPGGGLMLTVPQHQALWSRADTWVAHKRRYARRELTAKVARAGFRARLVTSFVSLLLPAMALSRLRDRVAPSTFDPLAELKPPAPLNECFEGALAFERALIRAGVRFPAGGSLLLVGTRV